MRVNEGEPGRAMKAGRDRSILIKLQLNLYIHKDSELRPYKKKQKNTFYTLNYAKIRCAKVLQIILQVSFYN